MTIYYIFRYLHRTTDSQCDWGMVATATNVTIHENLLVTKLKMKSLFHYNDLSHRKRVVLVFVCFIFPTYDSLTRNLLITTGTEALGLSVLDVHYDRVFINF